MALIYTGSTIKKNEPSRSIHLRNGSNNQHTYIMPKASKEIPPLKESAKIRFWRKVDRNGPMIPEMKERCWVWTACKDIDGYGNFGINGSAFRAHRVAFVLSGGILSGERNLALHRCDNPSCCNPAHIFAGSDADNMLDKKTKGRTARGDRHGSKTHPERIRRGKTHPSFLHPENVRKGEAHAMAKLNESQVACIRSQYRAGGITQKEIARDYNVSRHLISAIVCRRLWRHVA